MSGYKGLGQLPFHPDPFWAVTTRNSELRNPLKYWCAPNAATPDHVATHDLTDFLGYGLVMCWDNLTPENFSAWNMVDSTTLYDMREAFLSVCEDVILAIYERGINEETKSNDFDHGDWAKTVTIGRHDEDPKDEEEFMYSWFPSFLDDNSFALSLGLNVMYGNSGPCDDEVIWCNYSALKNRKAVFEKLKAAFEAAGVKVAFNMDRWNAAFANEGKEADGQLALCDRETKAD